MNDLNNIFKRVNSGKMLIAETEATGPNQMCHTRPRRLTLEPQRVVARDQPI